MSEKSVKNKDTYHQKYFKIPPLLEKTVAERHGDRESQDMGVILPPKVGNDLFITFNVFCLCYQFLPSNRAINI